MNKISKQLTVIIIASIVIFYLVPTIEPLLSDPLSIKSFFIFLLLIVNPLFCFVSSMIFTIDNGFKWYLSVLLGEFFLPTIFIFYNNSAIFYVFVYMAISLLGSTIALLLKKTQT